MKEWYSHQVACGLLALGVHGGCLDSQSTPSMDSDRIRTQSSSETESLMSKGAQTGPADLAPGALITVDWEDEDFAAHPAYFDVPAWNLNDSLFLYMKHDDVDVNDNRDDCYIADGQTFERLPNPALKGGAINVRGARNVGCVWSGSHANRVWYTSFDGTDSCLYRVDLGITYVPGSDDSRRVEVTNHKGDCHEEKLQMTPTYSQHSVDSDYAGWVLLAPTEGQETQRAYLYDENGTTDLVPEGLDVIDFEELIPDCDAYHKKDGGFTTDASCGIGYEKRCGFVHRVRFANRGNHIAPFLFAHNGVEAFILKAARQKDGTYGWESFQIRDETGPLQCPKHPAFSPDGTHMVYLQKRWKASIGGDTKTYIAVADLPSNNEIQEHTQQYTHDWNAGSGAHPAFRYPLAPESENTHREIIIDSRDENDKPHNGWIYRITGANTANADQDPSGDRHPVVKHRALWEGERQHFHPHPTTSNDGSMVTYGTQFFRTKVPNSESHPEVDQASDAPALTATPDAGGVRVYRFTE